MQGDAQVGANVMISGGTLTPPYGGASRSARAHTTPSTSHMHISNVPQLTAAQAAELFINGSSGKGSGGQADPHMDALYQAAAASGRPGTAPQQHQALVGMMAHAMQRNPSQKHMPHLPQRSASAHSRRLQHTNSGAQPDAANSLNGRQGSPASPLRPLPEWSSLEQAGQSGHHVAWPTLQGSQQGAPTHEEQQGGFPAAVVSVPNPVFDKPRGWSRGEML